MQLKLKDVPRGFPVRALRRGQRAKDRATCGSRARCGRSCRWTTRPLISDARDALAEAQAALDEWCADHDEELSALKELAEQAEGYVADWGPGETLIRDSYFKDYAQQLAEDLGAINREAPWPHNCIDWEQAARELQMDYTSVDFDGVTYWVR